MKKLIVMLLTLSAFSTHAANHTVCSGKQSFHSPYPGAGGSVKSLLLIDLEKQTGRISRQGSFHEKLTQVMATKNSHTGKVTIEAIDSKGQAVDLSIKIFGTSKIKLTGTLGNKKISFPCNRNLVLNL